MFISPYMSSKLENYYEKNGQTKNAALQMQSLEKISEIEREAIESRRYRRKEQQEQILNKSIRVLPSSHVVLKIVCAVAIVFLASAIFYKTRGAGPA